MLSADERQIGVTRLDEKQTTAVSHVDSARRQTLVLAVGKLQPDAKPTLAVIVEQER